MSHTGQCVCGAIRFTAEEVESHFHSCHCSTCRRWGGGPGMAARVGSVNFEGEDQIGIYQSSDWAERGFCKQCGSNLFYRLKEPASYMMWIGTFDDQTPFQLAGEIYIDAKPDSYNFAGEHPRQTEAEFLASIGMPPG